MPTINANALFKVTNENRPENWTNFQPPQLNNYYVYVKTTDDQYYGYVKKSKWFQYLNNSSMPRAWVTVDYPPPPPPPPPFGIAPTTPPSKGVQDLYDYVCTLEPGTYNEAAVVNEGGNIFQLQPSEFENTDLRSYVSTTKKYVFIAESTAPTVPYFVLLCSYLNYVNAGGVNFITYTGNVPLGTFNHFCDIDTNFQFGFRLLPC